MAQFPLERQLDEKDCGPACLSMISRYYGKTFSLEMFRRLAETSREGASLLNLSDAAEKIGFRYICMDTRAIGYDKIEKVYYAMGCCNYDPYLGKWKNGATDKIN